MDSTPIFGLGIPSADGSDGADLAALLRTLGLDVENKAGGITAMTSAARAALTGAGKYEGRVVHETDTDTLWRSDGTNWRQLVLFDSSGHLPMGGKKVTGLAAGTADGDAVRHEQLTAATARVRSGVITSAAAGYADVTFSPAFASAPAVVAVPALPAGASSPNSVPYLKQDEVTASGARIRGLTLATGCYWIAVGA